MTPDRIGRHAYQALLDEVYATPKPGLVDRSNSGAHSDMNLATFEASAAVLERHFTAFAKAGMETASMPGAEAFHLLRPMGQSAEEDMYAATGGVNTHKGAIFSLGLLSVAAGRSVGQRLPPSPLRLSRISREMTVGLCRQEYGRLSKRTGHTAGERVYLRYGVTGARGEAESGFASVRQYGYPRLRELLNSGADFNTACVRTLLCLMANVTDTNILARHDMETAREVRARAAALHRRFSMERLLDMDSQLIRRNISPGGSADLLAVTLFLHAMQKEAKQTNHKSRKGETPQW